MSSYTIAGYIRLSSEDRDIKKSGKLESNSITNQRHLIRDYISRQPDLAGANLIELCDDGWSGKNFERPGIKKLLQQAREGKIHCIIVKDLSRFGRDYLMVGNYISRVFPFLGVRFIAINDGFDSIRPLDMDSLETSFKTLLYDIYSRDLSRKVRSAKRLKAERGAFLSPFAPYGFIKDPSNKNHLLVDPEAAETVQRIFQAAIGGQSTVQIAQMLNAQQLPTPMLYKRTSGCSRTIWPSIQEENFWTDTMIIKILRDERYLGKAVYGKRTRDSVGNAHTVKVNRSDWVVVAHTHENIITQEEFDQAQAQLRKWAERDNSPIKGHPLYQKVRCGICGHILTRHKAKHPYYLCKTPRVTSAYACSTEKLLESDLMAALLENLRIQASYAVKINRIWEEQHRKRHLDIAATQKSLLVLKGRKDRLEQQIKGMYEDFALGNMSKTEYLETKSTVTKERVALTEQIAALEAQLENSSKDGKLQNRFVDSFQKYAAVQEITAEIMNDVLKEVIVYPDCKLEIVWNFREDYEKLLLATNANG